MPRTQPKTCLEPACPLPQDTNTLPAPIQAPPLLGTEVPSGGRRSLVGASPNPSTALCPPQQWQLPTSHTHPPSGSLVGCDHQQLQENSRDEQRIHDPSIAWCCPPSQALPPEPGSAPQHALTLCPCPGSCLCFHCRHTPGCRLKGFSFNNHQIPPLGSKLQTWALS